FFRAMIRCQAGISYEEAQNARDGHPNDRTRPLKEDIIDPLYEAYETLKRGQEKRSPLALEMPERTIKLTPRGEVEGVAIKERFDAHKLIEAMMVAANVCAAESLEKAKRPLIYRVHDMPNPERVDTLAEYLEAMGYSLPKGQVLKPQAFNRILQKASEREETDLVSLAILRTQSQAIYDTNNLGHFGLNLSRYAHFTSPIRRYADLTVHRGLVAAYKLGPGGVRQEQEKDLSRIAELITATERRAVSAERATQDRFLAAYLEEKVGTTFPARISGVTSAGVFVALDETGADGFVPMRSLQDDYYLHDEPTNRLVGQRTGGFYALGQRVEVELLEVTPLQGGLRFNMQTTPLAGKTPAKRKRSFRNPSPRGSSTPLTGKPNRKSDNAPSRKTKDKGLTLKRRPKKRD
ncbi:MAG: RNB domain-containing ribonuclease, partial [Pseudomonadota bacterium]